MKTYIDSKVSDINKAISFIKDASSQYNENKFTNYSEPEKDSSYSLKLNISNIGNKNSENIKTKNLKI